MFFKSIAKATFSFPYVLDPAFGALYHVHEVRRRAGDVMPYTFLLVSSEESVRRRCFFNKTARFTPFSVTTERSRCQGGGGGGWSAVFGPDQNVAQVVASAVRYERGRRECCLATLWRAKDIEVAGNDLAYVR